MKIPKELEEWIKLQPINHGVARMTAHHIINSPQKYGLVEISKVQGLVDFAKWCDCSVIKPNIGEQRPEVKTHDQVCNRCKALADWDKIKGGESG